MSEHETPWEPVTLVDDGVMVWHELRTWDEALEMLETLTGLRNQIEERRKRESTAEEWVKYAAAAAALTGIGLSVFEIQDGWRGFSIFLHGTTTSHRQALSALPREGWKPSAGSPGLIETTFNGCCVRMANPDDWKDES